MKRSTFAWTLPPGPPLTEPQRQLVAEALPVVPAVVGEVLKMRPRGRHFADDLPSVAAEGLVWAAQRFNPARGTRWASYAFWGARMRCLSWVKAALLRDGDAFLDAPLPAEDGDGSTLADILPGTETPPPMSRRYSDGCSSWCASSPTGSA